MTFGDDSEETWRLRTEPFPDKSAAEPESAWTPGMARIVGAIAQTLEAFPEALAAVQARMAQFREAPA